MLALKNDSNIGGAFVGCWIEAASLKKAINIAIEKINENDWDIIKKDQAVRIKEGHYSNNDSGFEFYQQALMDKCVLRFHTYPKEGYPI
jgi:hypothetical protein